jgi:malonyl CoA-acyl carrier protein transacylase
MSATTAILFPGQGSQTADMREAVARTRPELLELVIAAVGEDPFPRTAEGTNFAQPAIFTASLAGWSGFGSPSGDYMAGHSLGELAALVAAGALREADGIALVTLRGRLMHEAGLQAGDGGMVVVMGADASERAPEVALAHHLVIANDNSPQQVVLSGARAALPDAVSHAKDLGLRAMELDVTGAFHSPMMASAVPEFETALAGTEFREPVVPVISAVTAEPFTDPRRELTEALTRPVRWRETMLALHDRGVSRFIEVGPGRVLTGLAKRTLRDVELVNG